MHSQSCLDVASHIVGMFITVILMAGAILLIRRHQAGRTLHLLWAWINLALTVLFVASMVMALGMASTSGTRAELTKLLAMLVAGLIVGAGYPLFLIIYLGRHVTFRDLK